MASSENEYELPQPPTDGVTALRFPPASSRALLASSWDSTLRLYALGGGASNSSGGSGSSAPVSTTTLPCPLLDCDFVAGGGGGGDAATALSAGLDGVVRLHSGLDTASASATTTELGRHENGVRCVRSCAAVGPACAVSGSWDATLRLWDVRAATACVGTYAQPGKVLSLCAGGASSGSGSGAPLLLAAFTDRQVALVDLRNPSEPLQRRESSLKCQTRCVAQNLAGDGFALGSVEGRVAVEYVDPSEAVQATKYAFKCHRQSVGGVDTAFPVNAIAFHPVFGTFATGGGDGQVYVWDGAKKKRLSALRRYPTSVACLAFSPDGQSLAVASSYTYENGDVAHPPDAIFVRRLAEGDVKPKPPKQVAA